MAENAAHELNCQELVEVITDYLDGALSAEQRQRFERHLTYCQGCRAYLEQMRATLTLLGRLSTEDIPAQIQQELLAAFRGLRVRPE